MTLALVVPMGMNGVALSTLVSTLVVDILVVQPKAGRIYGFSFLSYYRVAALPSAVACIPMLIACYGVERFLAPHSLLNIACLELIGCIAFACSFLLFGMSHGERTYYWNRISGVLRHRA